MHGIIPSYCGVHIDPSSQLEGSSAPVPPEFSTQLHRLSALHFLSQITCEDGRRPKGELHSISNLRYEVAPILHQGSETASLIFQLSPFYDFTNPCLLWPSGFKLNSEHCSPDPVLWCYKCTEPRPGYSSLKRPLPTVPSTERMSSPRPPYHRSRSYVRSRENEY